MIIDPVEVLPVVDAFDTMDDERATTSARQVMRLLRESNAPFSRTSYDPGHVTASAIVISPDSLSILLVYHERLERWLQPGGHIEPEDPSVIAAARREVLEETGIQIVDEELPLVSVDVHEIPAARGEPEHLHHDLMFGFQLDAMVQPAEWTQTVWCSVSQLDRYGVDGALLNGVARALR
jgi:8-oxo-dGTP pyrophosphatase MutT (NUDIX family)